MLCKRIFKEPNKINFPDDIELPNKKSSIYALLLETKGDYKKVSQILDSKISETNELIRELTESIKTLPDDLFIEKLNKLKNDNFETMLLCDEFRKIASRKEKEQENLDFKVDVEKGFNENNKKLYEKPPIPKCNKSPYNICSNEYRNHHNMYFGESDRSHSLDSYRCPYYRENSHNPWKDDEDVDDEEEILRREENYKREEAFERLTKSKPKFYNDYDQTHSAFDPDSLVAKWRHKVTVPQPFEMTVREECKRKQRQLSGDNRLRKSRTLLEFQAERMEKELQDLEETKKQFKANPVPAHVYIPLYESMQEESNQRRQFIREYNKEILKSMEKPFNFYKRELEKQRMKSESTYPQTESSKSFTSGMKNTSNRGPLKSYHSERHKTIIKAKEIPKSTNDPTTTEKMKEEELFRQIKAEMRSKHLMESSKMPGNMAERQRIQEEKRRRKQFKDLNLRRRSKSADSSRIHKSVPDFSKIHREWEEEIRMSYKEPHVTQPKPFNLLTEQRPFNRSANDITQNHPNPAIHETTKSEWNKSILAALEMAKPSTNKSTMLREIALKTKQIDEETKTHNKAIEQLAKKKREIDVSEKIRKSLEIDLLPKGEDKRRQKTKELKVEGEHRKENYQRELDEMKKKVNQKPLLLEAPMPKNKPPGGYNRDGLNPKKMSNRKPTNYNGYDERNNFGDPASYRSSTDASGSLNGVQSYQKNNANVCFE